MEVDFGESEDEEGHENYAEDEDGSDESEDN